MGAHKKKSILVIEDETALLNVVTRKLEKKGYNYMTARSVEQAVAELNKAGMFDAIWLDHFLLGQKNGLDFLTKIKSDEKWKSIPVFIISNASSPDKVQSYLQLGVNKYYVKVDFRLDQIISEISTLLKKKNKKSKG